MSAESNQPEPAPTIIIEKLNQGHSLSEFDCSNRTLDAWLKRYAWTSQRAETAKTYVAHRGERVLGYHALLAGSVLKQEAPERIVQGPANHPVGVILLTRLAVDKTEQVERLFSATPLGEWPRQRTWSEFEPCWFTRLTTLPGNSTSTTVLNPRRLTPCS